MMPAKTRMLDEFLMQRALALARRGIGRTRPNPPVGAVVAHGSRVVGAGFHRQAGGPHAEIVALRAAGAKARGATLYVTLEPCCTTGRTGRCTDAVIAAGIARVVVAVRDPNPAHRGRGLRTLRGRGIQVTEGVCREEAARLIAPFAKWITTGLPYVTLKAGMTLDGRIADGQGRSRWITGEAARRVGQRLRHAADAVMVGARTALLDNPSLLCRRCAGRIHPLRVIVDSSGRLPAAARVLTDGHAAMTIVATTGKCTARAIRRFRASGAAVWILPDADGRVSLRHLLKRLGQAGCLHVLCEGGGEIAEALVRTRLIDEYVFCVASRLLGGGASVPVIGGKGWPLGRSPRLRFVECRRVGEDVALRAVPAQPREDECSRD